MRVCCLINGRSGTAGGTPEERIQKLFATHAITPKIIKIQEGMSIASLAEDAIAQNYDVIVAGGGDGTINAVASAIVGNSAIKFGIIPLGTLNHFAGALGIPFEIKKAVEIIVAGHVKAIDVGDVNGRIFVNNSSLGLYPAIVKLRERLQKSGHKKWPAAVWAAFRIFIRFRRLHFELVLATGATMSLSTAVLFVGNNAYDMSLPNPGARSSLDEGHICVMMPTSSTRWGLLSSFFAMLTGREQPGDVVTLDATELTVTSNRKILKVAVDGEVLSLSPPLTYRSLSKSLRVIVPIVGKPVA